MNDRKLRRKQEEEIVKGADGKNEKRRKTCVCKWRNDNREEGREENERFRSPRETDLGIYVQEREDVEIEEVKESGVVCK